MTHNGNRTTLETLIPENAVTNGLFAIIAITCCLATAVTTQYTYFSSSQTFCNLWLGTTFEINNFFTSCNIKYCLWDKKKQVSMFRYVTLNHDTHLFLPYLKRFAANTVQNRQKSTLKCVLKHFWLFKMDQARICVPSSTKSVANELCVCFSFFFFRSCRFFFSCFKDNNQAQYRHHQVKHILMLNDL